MPHKSHIWCSHPFHDEVLSNGKKRCSKFGPKPSHPKGKRSINEQLAIYINSHNEDILNGTSKKLSEGDYLCATCFTKEESLFMNDEETNMDIDDCEESLNYNNLHDDSGFQQCSPMDDDDHVEHEDIKLSLNQVFQFVNVKKIDDFHNTKQISNAIDETYFKLREWSNTILPSSRRDEKPEIFDSLNVSIDDAVSILNHLRELFRHQARRSIELRTAGGVFSKPEDRRGNKSLDEQIELTVHNFYTSDEVSRETSYKKQVIHPPPSRKPVPLRFLHSNIGETYQQFKSKYINIEISRSKFSSLRPVWVRDQIGHESCMCIYHENADLVLQGISKSLHHLVSMKNLIEETICTSPSEFCYYRPCVNCRQLKPSDILSDGIDIEIEDSASWSIWKKLNSRYELLHLTGTIRALLEEIDSLWPHFIIHNFYTREQRDYIALIKETSSISTFAVVQVDFAQNFTLIIQREIQSAYYSRQQATIFTIYIKVGEEHRNMVLISDYLAHDTQFVYSGQKLIVDFLRTQYPNVLKLNYASDGASAHFKNKYNMYNLAHHHADFNIAASWTFSATGHGKGPCDGVGAVVKSTATQHLLKGGPNASFSSPKQFYEWC
ncbi:unnamed protein product, partial [Rotaria socialis]